MDDWATAHAAMRTTARNAVKRAGPREDHAGPTAVDMVVDSADAGSSCAEPTNAYTPGRDATLTPSSESGGTDIVAPHPQTRRVGRCYRISSPMPHHRSRTVSIASLVADTAGFSGADLRRVVEDAKLLYAYARANHVEPKPVVHYFADAIALVASNKAKYHQAITGRGQDL